MSEEICAKLLTVPQFPGLEKTGEFAERYLYSDSNSCLFKLGLLCEDIVNKMFDFDNIAMPYQMKDTLINKIRLLENEEYITEDLARIMHRLRLGGNEARHEGTDSLQTNPASGLRICAKAAIYRVLWQAGLLP